MEKDWTFYTQSKKIPHTHTQIYTQAHTQSNNTHSRVFSTNSWGKLQIVSQALLSVIKGPPKTEQTGTHTEKQFQWGYGNFRPGNLSFPFGKEPSG